MTPRTQTLAVSVMICWALQSCALLGKSDPLTPRYFTLTGDPREGAPSSTNTATTGGPRLALGRVSASAALRERIVYRSAEHEVGYYEDRRWTERPDVYLRRALVTALFERRGLTRAVSGAAPILQAELVTFEEIRGKRPRVRMQVAFTLDDNRSLQVTETITIERDVAQASGDKQANAVVVAFGEALRAGVDQIADHVVTKLAAVPAAPAEAVEQEADSAP
jgi:cholesterol transport system auxiliary component